ncbi:TolC family protein [Neomoorella thermoacetica]|uniref:TolC family protein n=1 Tax=Neomoorella thermoacetica TaxID=1525 RepID=UPI0008FAF737|nr:TolC family protein [Moorella thermoacetica]APC09540.1 outer membrane efflux protein [Moorella thermoacetica]
MHKRKFAATVLGAFLLLFTNIPLAKAAESTAPQLTLQQAIDQAIANSNILKADSLAIDQAKYDRDAAGLNVTFTPSGPTTTVAEKAFTQLQQADLKWQVAKKNYDADKDTVVMKVYQAYFGVIQAQAALDAAQKALLNIDWQRKVANMSFQAGIISNSQMQQTANGYSQAQAQLASAQKALDNAYEKFNQLVGLMPDERPVLVDRPTFMPLTINSLDAEVSRVLDASPTVWLMEKNVDLAKLALDLYSFGPTEPHTYKATEIQVPIAEQNVANVRSQMSQLVRSLYYSIKQAEENYTSLQYKLAIDKENLRVAEVKYSAGLATKGDIISAQATLAQDIQNIENVLCQHQILVKAFEKPWAYVGSTSS